MHENTQCPSAGGSLWTEALLKGESGLDERRKLSFMSYECPYFILQISYLLYVTSDDSAFTVWKALTFLVLLFLMFLQICYL